VAAWQRGSRDVTHSRSLTHCHSLSLLSPCARDAESPIARLARSQRLMNFSWYCMVALYLDVNPENGRLQAQK